MFEMPRFELRVRVRRGRSSEDEGRRHNRVVGLRLHNDPLTGEGRTWQWVVDMDSERPALADVLANCHGFLVDDDCGCAVGVVEDVLADLASGITEQILVVQGWGRRHVAVPMEDVVEVAPGARRLVIACRDGHASTSEQPGRRFRYNVVDALRTFLRPRSTNGEADGSGRRKHP